MSPVHVVNDCPLMVSQTLCIEMCVCINWWILVFIVPHDEYHSVCVSGWQFVGVCLGGCMYVQRWSTPNKSSHVSEALCSWGCSVFICVSALRASPLKLSAVSTRALGLYLCLISEMYTEAHVSVGPAGEENCGGNSTGSHGALVLMLRGFSKTLSLSRHQRLGG